jgi:hypothetical protein
MAMMTEFEPYDDAPMWPWEIEVDDPPVNAVRTAIDGFTFGQHEYSARERKIIRQAADSGVCVNPKAIPGRAKPSIYAVPMGPVQEVGEVCANGANKYGLKNWRDQPIQLSDYLNALFRHFKAVCEGEDIDPVKPADPNLAPGSGLRHLAHIAATCLIVMDAQDHGSLIDDRWEPKQKDAP